MYPWILRVCVVYGRPSWSGWPDEATKMPDVTDFWVLNLYH